MSQRRTATWGFVTRRCPTSCLAATTVPWWWLWTPACSLMFIEGLALSSLQHGLPVLQGREPCGSHVRSLRALCQWQRTESCDVLIGRAATFDVAVVCAKLEEEADLLIARAA